MEEGMSRSLRLDDRLVYRQSVNIRIHHPPRTEPQSLSVASDVLEFFDMQKNLPAPSLSPSRAPIPVVVMNMFLTWLIGYRPASISP